MLKIPVIGFYAQTTSSGRQSERTDQPATTNAHPQFYTKLMLETLIPDYSSGFSLISSDGYAY